MLAGTTAASYSTLLISGFPTGSVASLALAIFVTGALQQSVRNGCGREKPR